MPSQPHEKMTVSLKPKRPVHAYDPGVYNLTLFAANGRRRPHKLLVRNFLRAVQVCGRWKRRTGGSAVVMKCVYNTQLARPAYSSEDQA